MATKEFKIEDLKIASYNPRVEQKPGMKTYEHIKASIEKFGYVDLMVVNVRNNVIVGGHQRLTVLKDLGFNKVECTTVDLDEPMEKALNIALNKITGKWDEELLSSLVYELKDLPEFDVGPLGFTLQEVDDLSIFLPSMPPTNAATTSDAQLYPDGPDGPAQVEGEIPRGVPVNPDAPAPIEYARPEFKEICDTFSQNKTSDKNGNWFYVEYYQDDETFDALKKALGPYLKGQSGYEIRGDVFARVVMDAFGDAVKADKEAYEARLKAAEDADAENKAKEDAEE